MIGTSLHEYISIRICIYSLQYTTPLCLLSLIGFSLIDLAYAVFVYIPYNQRLKQEAKHPPLLSSEERRALFNKVLHHIPDFERYVRLWFLGADANDIRRDNVRDFILWAFFDRASGHQSDEEDAEAEEYVDAIEERLDRKLELGRGDVESFRLTLDAVETRYRSLLWYVIVGLVDFVAHCQLAWNGFQYHAQPRSKTFSVFPPRLQSIFARRRSASKELSYWHRPHTAPDGLPVVFLHGIGIGLWTYVPFLSRLNENGSADNGQIGVIAVEILPVSFRLTSAPLDKIEFLDQLGVVLESHGWNKYVLAAHSYGTVLATHMIKSPALGGQIESVVLIDPVSILLHIPDVAYNFTRRKPRRANEWLLWFFASMDPGVAHALGRHFFWRENIIWKEELLNLPGEGSTSSDSIHDEPRRRNVAVCLSELDLIVDTVNVAQYLAESEEWILGRNAGKPRASTIEESQSGDGHMTGDGIQLLWFPGRDHAQAFNNRQDYDRICRVIRRYCRR
ncbi:hypothetical protein BJ170DRAFT_588507 [Xylariales sp. AK1849]|nr:hypothetical protein BJ170DRAFT_588507 [Xylariales sp. AK1849]